MALSLITKDYAIDVTVKREDYGIVILTVSNIDIHCFNHDLACANTYYKNFLRTMKNPRENINTETWLHDP